MGVDNVAAAVESGFDYVEVAACDLASSPNVAPYKHSAVETTNLFFPHGTHLFGNEPFEWRPYASVLLAKAAEVGIQLMVVGSGYARSAPEGSYVPDCELRFIEIIAEIQELADPYGIKIAPESLRKSETNVWNDPSALAQALAEMGIGYTFDTYHALEEWTLKLTQVTVDQLLGVKPSHVHLASRSRLEPRIDDGEVLMCLRSLAKLKYDGRCSLEVSHMDRGEWPQVTARLRQLLSDSGL